MKIERIAHNNSIVSFTLPEAYIAARSHGLTEAVDAARREHIKAYPPDLQVTRKVIEDARQLRETAKLNGDFLDVPDEGWERIQRGMLLEARENRYFSQIGTVAHVIGPLSLRNLDLFSLHTTAEFQIDRIDEELEARSVCVGRLSVVADPEAASLLVESVAARSILETVEAFCGPELPKF